MAKIVCRSYRDVKDKVKLTCEDPSLTVQASKDECDLNVIIRKYLRTGELPEARHAAYADLSQIGNLQDSLNSVIAAEQAFMALPAETRRYFDNDPVKLVNFAADDRNYSEAVRLGLVSSKDRVSLPSQQVPSAPGQGASNAVGGTPENPAKSGS